MNRKIGFTLIELLITITIVVVLLTLTVVSLRSSQATARDEERKTDVAVIAQNLENYYQSGSDAVVPSHNATLASVSFPGSAEVKLAAAVYDPYPPGRYPPTQYMASETEIKKALRDIDPAVLRAPDVPDTSPISLVVATSTSEPNPSVNTYVYQPLKVDGTLCTTGDSDGGDECRRYTLFYKLETNNTVQKITSKHQ